MFSLDLSLDESRLRLETQSLYTSRHGEKPLCCDRRFQIVDSLFSFRDRPPLDPPTGRIESESETLMERGRDPKKFSGCFYFKVKLERVGRWVVRSEVLSSWGEVLLQGTRQYIPPFRNVC